MRESHDISEGFTQVIRKPESGGSLTVAYKPDDVIARSIGHLLALPSHLYLLNPQSSFKDADPHFVEQVIDRYKGVPWKGDILVRIGHGSLVGDMYRMFAPGIKGRPNVFLRLLSIPEVVLANIETRLWREDHYNPYTNTSHIYRPKLGSALHEVGHAEFFDQSKARNFWVVLGMLPRLASRLGIPLIKIPGFESFLEWKASANAMRRFESDMERRQELKIMEAGFSSHVMYDLLTTVLPFVGIPKELFVPFLQWGRINLFNYIDKPIVQFDPWNMGAFASGHILSRTPYPVGKRQRFEWVFGGNNPPRIETPSVVEAPKPYADILRNKSEAGGSLTVIHKQGDIVEQTLGHILAIPQHLGYWTPKDVFKNVTKEQAETLFRAWKDVPWKGDVQVRIGHSSLWSELVRTFDFRNIKGRPNFFVRTAGLPITLAFWAAGKSARMNYFNPLTNTVSVYHPHHAIGMHELGRAKYFESSPIHPYLWTAGNLINVILPLPGIRSFYEWKANELALRRYDSDAKRREALGVLEAKFGTTVFQELVPSALRFMSSGPLDINYLIASYLGALIGHGMARHYPKQRERFGYVFEGKKPPSSEPIAYAQARAPGR